MYTADAHCDALLKIAQSDSPTVNRETLKRGGVGLQNFALFAPVENSIQDQQEMIIKEMTLFHMCIQQDNNLHWNPNSYLQKENSYTDAILSLEGAGMFRDDLDWWRDLKNKGLEMASLTWNEKNDLAAGSAQSNRYGVTKAGEKVIKWQHENQIVTDAAHLNEKSFWRVMELADLVTVSHANVRALHDHPRNLTDEQISALVRKEGFLGLTFYPLFINGTNSADFSDLGRQVEHLCTLGAAHIIGFGSDFDGVPATVDGLSNPSHYPSFIEWLLKRFDESIVEGIAGENFRRFWNNKRSIQD
ncbi:membrane dipeptidase [Salibacterium salarium]|uniref:Membrane dipeptidase n=1 Tax=Salibacterium salarium TaxID=284579 RepID=A0A3R9P5H9_9BACI|nr:membrane dipeptidase [Salibacterium salarium]RSL33283.1 membrane dipeptidase [Salibacterium salarium]